MINASKAFKNALAEGKMLYEIVDIAFADSALPPVALVLDIPEPQAEAVAPQRDPKAPPRLRW